MSKSISRKDARNGLIAPSILSADFSKLGTEVQEVDRAGADWIHVDVMDGHFVPNLTIGPLVVNAIRPKTEKILDCHLMVSQPENWIGPFADVGADIITVHSEATHHLHRLLNAIRERDCLAGVSVNPATPVVSLAPILDEVDLVLIMSVNPGFGGQKFIEQSIEKIVRLNEMRADRKFLIEVDGGVGPKNIKALHDAGCDVFVAGSAIFAAHDRSAAIRDLKDQLKG